MLTRQIRLTLNTWKRRIAARVDALRVWYEQRTCPHFWQAALVNKHPARVCKMCDVAQELSREDFYAEFGERYQAILYTGAPTVFGETKPTVETESVN